MISDAIPENQAIPDVRHLDDIKLAASELTGAERRAFQATMALKYCAGSPRQAEVVFGWIRRAVELGRHEKRTGIVCPSVQSAFAGKKLWDEKYPDAANALWVLAQSHSQPDPSCLRGMRYFGNLLGSRSYTRIEHSSFAIPCAIVAEAIAATQRYSTCETGSAGCLH